MGLTTLDESAGLPLPARTHGRRRRRRGDGRGKSGAQHALHGDAKQTRYDGGGQSMVADGGAADGRALEHVRSISREDGFEMRYPYRSRSWMSVAGMLAALVILGGCGPSLQRVAVGSAASGLKVAVREFSMTYQTPMAHTPFPSTQGSFGQRLIKTLRQGGVDAELAPEATAHSDVLIEGEITWLSRGNRGLRYLGVDGAARFTVQGRALRADGTVLGEFGANRHADFGLFGGNSDTLLNNCIEAVAIDVANMVILGEYRFLQDGVVLGGNALVKP